MKEKSLSQTSLKLTPM